MIEHMNEQKDILNLYRLFIFSIICQIVPFYTLQVFGFILFTVVLIWAYLLKIKYFKDPFGKSHAIHVIKTVWNFSFFLLFGLMIAGTILYLKADQTAFIDYTDQIISSGGVSEEGMNTALKQVLKDNWGLVIKVGLPTLLPSIIYLVFRIHTGYSNAGCERKM